MKPKKLWTQDELPKLIGSPFANVQRFLVEKLPINLLPSLLEHPNTRESVRRLIFERLPFKMIPTGFKRQYKQWLVERVLNS